MTQTPHTPGPWQDRGPIGAGKWITAPEGQVAVVYGPNTNPASEANARLISAAPCLLDALKAVMQHGRIDNSEARMNQVAAAIAKATGT